MTKFTIAFLIGIAVYLFGLAVFCIIKAIRNKRKYKKDLEAYEQEESSETSVEDTKE